MQMSSGCTFRRVSPCRTDQPLLEISHSINAPTAEGVHSRRHSTGFAPTRTASVPEAQQSKVGRTRPPGHLPAGNIPPCLRTPHSRIPGSHRSNDSSLSGVELRRRLHTSMPGCLHRRRAPHAEIGRSTASGRQPEIAGLAEREISESPLVAGRCLKLVHEHPKERARRSMLALSFRNKLRVFSRRSVKSSCPVCVLASSYSSATLQSSSCKWRG